MVFGLVRGSRFWDWESSQQLWSWLLPVFQQVLNNVTSETQSYWDYCFSRFTSKADPNRLRWLLELLVTPENLVRQVSYLNTVLRTALNCINSIKLKVFNGITLWLN